MNKLLLTVTAIVLNSVTISADTVVVIPDTPNVGDFTTVTTVTTGNPVTSNNLISQDFADGTWNGTMFPDNSDLNHSTWLTGKEGKYAETSIDSEDYVSLEELKLGFTSNFMANIRWWNQVESTVTMTQSISNGIDTTTQSTTFEDTTNSSYQVNPYGNTLVVNPDANMTHGTATYRFDFDIINNNQAGYNGGHAGVDVRDPSARIDYTALSSTTISEITYCWQQTPPTCPGQEEIEDVQDIIEEIDTIIVDFEVPEDTFLPEYVEIDYEFNNIFEDEIIIEEDTFEILALDKFFFEEDYFQTDYYEEPELEVFFPEDIMLVEEIEMFDALPPIEMFEEMPVIEEIYEAVPETMFVEEFTDEMQEEFIDEVEEYFEEPMEEIAMVEEEVVPMQEEPSMPVQETIQEEVVQEESIQEEVIEEEPTEEIASEIEEQPSSEEPTANEPEPTTEVAEQEEVIEEPIEEGPTEVAEEPGTEPKGDVEVDLDIKVAKIEQAIQSKIKNVAQQIDATLTVINEVVSREMISQEPDMSSYFNTNLALFDTRQLPSGNQDFFLQASLASYSKPIYVAQVSIADTDPVVQYQIKVNNAKQKTNEAYKKLKELLNARNIQ
jgi:hypothetical protein